MTFDSSSHSKVSAHHGGGMKCGEIYFKKLGKSCIFYILNTGLLINCMNRKLLDFVAN